MFLMCILIFKRNTNQKCSGVTLFDDDIDMSDPHALEKLIEAESQESATVVADGETKHANHSEHGDQK
mgnify:CR=1 FL=1